MTRPTIDHVGVVVADLDQAVARLAPLFGGPPPTLREMPDVGLRVAEFEAANLTVELLQYTGGNDALARRTMGDAPGLNHISTRVEDLPEAVAALTAKGFALQEGFPLQGAHGEVAFFKPDPATGLLLELCRPDKEPQP